MTHLSTSDIFCHAVLKEGLSFLPIKDPAILAINHSIFHWVMKSDGKNYYFPTEGYKSYYTLPINKVTDLGRRLQESLKIAKSFCLVGKNTTI